VPEAALNLTAVRRKQPRRSPPPEESRLIRCSGQSDHGRQRAHRRHGLDKTSTRHRTGRHGEHRHQDGPVR